MSDPLTLPEWDKIRDQLMEINPEMVLYDGLEDAFLGVLLRFNQEPIATYDYYKCIDIRMQDGGNYEDAVEFHDYNTMGLWAGDHTPAFLMILPLNQKEMT